MIFAEPQGLSVELPSLPQLPLSDDMPMQLALWVDLRQRTALVFVGEELLLKLTNHQQVVK